MKSVGIDIGTSSIKIVEVVASNKGIQITQFIEHILGQNPAFDPEIEIIEFLRNFVSTYDQATTRFVFGMKQDRVSVRNKIFPFSDRQKILKSLPFELEEDLPFSSDTAQFDAKIIKTMGGSAEVLACATPKHRVTDALKLMQDSGIDVSVLSAEGIAFANCFERWNEAPQALPSIDSEVESFANERSISIVVHLGHTRSLACAFEDNHMIGIRTMLWGGKNIAEAIARRYEIPYIEALKEMQTKAFILPSKEGASYDQIVFSDTIAAQVRDLARELKISILEFKSEFNGSVKSVELTGGTSQILNLHPYLTQNLELPVNKMQILDRFGSVNFEKATKIDSVIAVALGLAIEGLKKPRNPALNFLRGEFARQNVFIKSFWNKWGPTIQITAAAFVVFCIYGVVREHFATSLADKAYEAMKNQARIIAKLPARNQNERGVKNYIRDQRKKSQEMSMISGLTHMNSGLDIIKKINDATPGKNSLTLNVKKLDVADSSVRIEGTVASQRELSLLQSALANVSLDGKVQQLSAGGVQLGGTAPGAVPFAYSFRVDRATTKTTN